jgi:hypothetical protein
MYNASILMNLKLRILLLHNRYSRMVYDVGGHKATRVVLQCINGVSLNSVVGEQIYVAVELCPEKKQSIAQKL